MTSCHLCPRACGAMRTVEQPGFCGDRTSPGFFRVAKTMIHAWEEPYISGTRGSGAVFFSGCPLGCLFCQNHRISHASSDAPWPGRDFSEQELADELQRLVDQGVHNLNLVTASHFAQAIPGLVRTLRARQVSVPIVWNTSAYETVATLQSLRGSIDVYLPDFKFWDRSLSADLAQAPEYAQIATRAILEMHRQQPAAVFNADGLLQRGVALRLLVLPSQYRDAQKIIDWMAENLPPDIPLAIMNQYTPFPENFARMADHPELKRRLTTYEYQKVIEHAQNKGFTRLLGQERAAASALYTPDF